MTKSKCKQYQTVSGFDHVLYLVRRNNRQITGWIQLGSSRSIRATTHPGSNTVPDLFKKWMQPECWTCRVITIFITYKKWQKQTTPLISNLKHLCQCHIRSYTVWGNSAFCKEKLLPRNVQFLLHLYLNFSIRLGSQNMRTISDYILQQLASRGRPEHRRVSLFLKHTRFVAHCDAVATHHMTKDQINISWYIWKYTVVYSTKPLLLRPVNLLFHVGCVAAATIGK